MAESDSVSVVSGSTSSSYSSLEPSTSCHKGSNEEQSSDTDPDHTVEHDEQPVPSLLARLRAPTPSKLARKRKGASNPPSGKWRSRGSTCTEAPKSVKPAQRVREYSTEPFVVSNNALFCRGCGEELCVKSSSIKNHCRSAKHLQGKERLEKQQSREQDIADALLAYNKEVHPRGETLPPNQLVFRVKVVRTFLKAGVPLRKIELFRDLLEETAFRLTDRRFMMDFCFEGGRGCHQE